MLRQSIVKGALTLTYPDGATRRYGEDGAEPVRVRLTDPSLPRRVMLNPDLGLGEGYMDGGLQIADDDLHGFLRFAVANSESAWSHPLHRNLWAIRRLIRPLVQNNSASRARARVKHHYDLSGELYDLFLDADKQYSCAYFRNASDTLEQAQEQKKRHIAEKLMIEPGMRVLDIGCGWGGMALTLARDYGARVVGVTLSEEQFRAARRRAQEAGLSEAIDIRLCDYREVEGTFDRIVSVGMFEHVGVPHYRAYFRTVRERLTEDGIALIHTIGSSTPPRANSPWIERYIFPGGYIPSMSEAMAAIEHESLVTADVEVWRLHYAYTLRNWYDRFTAHEARAEQLYDKRFCRMWRYYLAACEATFRSNRQVVFQFQLARRIDAVPITRDYLYGHDAQRHGSMAAE